MVFSVTILRWYSTILPWRAAILLQPRQRVSPWTALSSNFRILATFLTRSPSSSGRGGINCRGSTRGSRANDAACQQNHAMPRSLSTGKMAFRMSGQMTPQGLSS